jgi:hypothetical protein
LKLSSRPFFAADQQRFYGFGFLELIDRGLTEFHNFSQNWRWLDMSIETLKQQNAILLFVIALTLFSLITLKPLWEAPGWPEQDQTKSLCQIPN